MKAHEILQRAASLVGGDRQAQHGDKLKNFTNIAVMWNAYLKIRRDPNAELDAEDVGHMMSLMKKARTQTGNFNSDDYDDEGGYVGCTGEVAHALRAPTFHTGGVVGLKKDEQPPVVIRNVIDPDVSLGGADKSVAGGETLLNFIRRNPAAFRQIVEGGPARYNDSRDHEIIQAEGEEHQFTFEELARNIA